jgi:peptidyl-prolyl cis-trans isomerase D
MAVITKIREKYAKLAGAVIAISLIGFLLMDAGDNLRKLFTGSNYVVKVNGDKIDPKEYASRIAEYESLYEMMGNKLDDNMRAQVHDQVLRELVFERAAAKDMDKLGLTVTDDELKQMITGDNPDPMVLQFPYFKNPQTQQFDPQAVTAFETGKISANPNDPEAIKALDLWKQWKNFMRRNRLTQKYTALFGGAAYMPKFVMDQQQKDQAFTASIKYVKVPFTMIGDAEVKVTDADLNEYVKKHSAKYRIEDPTRSIDYVAFEVLPSKDDTARTLGSLQPLISEFATATDVESFVNRNSEEQSLKGDWVTKKSFSSPLADSILAQPVGAVVGPYFENNTYRLTKVIAKTMLPDSVKVRHILVKTKAGSTEVLADSLAKRRIDSAIAAIEGGQNFGAVALKYSEDEGSKNKGGEYEFQLPQRSQLSKEFGDVAFEGKPGERKLVKVENDAYSGYHYIEVMSQSSMNNAVKLAIVTKALFADDATETAAYGKASEFAGNNTTGKKFDEAVTKNSLNKQTAQNVKVNDFVIPGIGASREIIRWIYNARPGDVSEVFKMDNKYIVAKLTGEQAPGPMKIDDANRPMLEGLVKAEKKAALIIEKYKKPASLETLASAIGQQVQTAENINAGGGYIPNMGFEPMVAGYAFNAKFQPNTVSPGIKGQDGVYYFVVTSRQQAPVPASDPNQMASQRKMMSMQMKGNIGNMQQEVMRKKANVKYSAENLY